MVRFCPLFSGSGGNCTYISSGDFSILIDAGVSAKAICTALRDIDADPDKISAVFVTHEHSDHIKGLRVFASKHDIPVYANEATMNELLKHRHSDVKGMRHKVDCDVCLEYPLEEHGSVNVVHIVLFRYHADKLIA